MDQNYSVRRLSGEPLSKHQPTWISIIRTVWARSKRCWCAAPSNIGLNGTSMLYGKHIIRCERCINAGVILMINWNLIEKNATTNDTFVRRKIPIISSNPLLSDWSRLSAILMVLLYSCTCWLLPFASHCWLTKQPKSIPSTFLHSQPLAIWYTHWDKCSTFAFMAIGSLKRFVDHIQTYILIKNSTFLSTQEIINPLVICPIRRAHRSWRPPTAVTGMTDLRKPRHSFRLYVSNVKRPCQYLVLSSSLSLWICSLR